MPDLRRSSILVLLFIASAAASSACGSGRSADIGKDTTGPNGRAAGAGDGRAQAGSRLLPLSFRGSDGSQSFAGLFDKQLQRPCTFEPLGSVNVCVPADVYTVSAEVFYDSYKAASPSLYLDPKCGEPTAIALSDEPGAGCAQYGVIRIIGSRYQTDTPGCGWSARPSGLAVVTPIAPGTKVYAWGQGGGQCCECAEWVPPSHGNYRAYRVETSPDESQIGAVKLVTATVDYPTAP